MGLSDVWDDVKGGFSDGVNWVKGAKDYVWQEWKDWENRAKQGADALLNLIKSPTFMIIAGGVILIVLFKK